MGSRHLARVKQDPQGHENIEWSTCLWPPKWHCALCSWLEQETSFDVPTELSLTINRAMMGLSGGREHSCTSSCCKVTEAAITFSFKSHIFPSFLTEGGASVLPVGGVWRRVLFPLCSPLLSVCARFLICLWRAAYFFPWNSAWCQHAALVPKPCARKSSCGEGRLYKSGKCMWWTTVNHWKNFQGT